MDSIELKMSMVFSSIFVMIFLIGGLWLIFSAIKTKIMVTRISPIHGKVVRIKHEVRNGSSFDYPIAEYFRNGETKEAVLKNTKVNIGESIELYIGEKGKIYEPNSIQSYLIIGAVLIGIGAIIFRNIITMLL